MKNLAQISNLFLSGEELSPHTYAKRPLKQKQETDIFHPKFNKKKKVASKPTGPMDMQSAIEKLQAKFG